MSGCLCNQLVHLNIHSFKIYSLFQGQLARHWSPRSCFGLDVTRCKRVASAVMGQHWNLGYRRKEGRKCGTFLNSKRKSESSCSTEDSKMCLSFLSGSSYSVFLVSVSASAQRFWSPAPHHSYSLASSSEDSEDKCDTSFCLSQWKTLQIWITDMHCVDTSHPNSDPAVAKGWWFSPLESWYALAKWCPCFQMQLWQC